MKHPQDIFSRRIKKKKNLSVTPPILDLSINDMNHVTRKLISEVLKLVKRQTSMYIGTT